MRKTATGLTREEIENVRDRVLESKKIIVCWAMGLTQHKHGVPPIREIVKPGQSKPSDWLMFSNVSAIRRTVVCFREYSTRVCHGGDADRPCLGWRDAHVVIARVFDGAHGLGCPFCCLRAHGVCPAARNVRMSPRAGRSPRAVMLAWSSAWASDRCDGAWPAWAGRRGHRCALGSADVRAAGPISMR
jgi:hypothetical protein